MRRSFVSLLVLAAVNAATPPHARAQYGPGGLPEGNELVVAYIGATTCGPCRTDELKSAIREIPETLGERG